MNYYAKINNLSGWVNDAYAVNSVLESHGDGTTNFDTVLITSVDSASSISRRTLKELITELFSDDSQVALFYFSGHRHIENTGGYVLTSECDSGDDGLPMNDILTIVNTSPAKNKIVILDACYSGQMGNVDTQTSTASINEGVTILTASQKTEMSVDEGSGSTFTNLLVDALSGSAANLLGDVSPGGVYAHIDQSLGAWQQRPIFKTNVKNFISLRKVQPPIPLEDLLKINEIFSNGFEYPLDPSYEPESDSPVKENTEIFAILQKYNRVNLVVPVGAPHMYHAAMESKSCKLTVVGEHYWRLVNEKRI